MDMEAISADAPMVTMETHVEVCNISHMSLFTKLCI